MIPNLCLCRDHLEFLCVPPRLKISVTRNLDLSLWVTDQFPKPSHSHFLGRKNAHSPNTCPWRGSEEDRPQLRMRVCGRWSLGPLTSVRLQEVSKGTQVRKPWTMAQWKKKPEKISGRGQNNLLVTPAPQPQLDPFQPPVTLGRSVVTHALSAWLRGECPERVPKLACCLFL